MSPPPPSQVLPWFLDQTTHMWYGHVGSLCTEPAVDSAAHFPGLSLGPGVANARYGLPLLSSVKPVNGVEASWPMPASYASAIVHDFPMSSDHATNRLWKDWTMVTLQPVAGLSGSDA